MKGLTTRQPWAQMIMRCGKDIENRDWFTRIRGRIAIHSSARLLPQEVANACNTMREFVPKFSTRIFSAEVARCPEMYPLGAILGTVELVDCVSASDSPWFCGDYGFVLRNPIVLASPIPFKGALGFWDVPEEIAARLAA